MAITNSTTKLCIYWYWGSPNTNVRKKITSDDILCETNFVPNLFAGMQIIWLYVMHCGLWALTIFWLYQAPSVLYLAAFELTHLGSSSSTAEVSKDTSRSLDPLSAEFDRHRYYLPTFFFVIGEPQRLQKLKLTLCLDPSKTPIAANSSFAEPILARFTMIIWNNS